MEDVSQAIHRHLLTLEDPNKVQRKKSLEGLKQLIEKHFPEGGPSQEDAPLILLWQERLCRPLLRCLGSDPGERVRELSGEIILYILSQFPSYRSQGSDYFKLSYIFPLIQSRLVTDTVEVSNFKEPSEEVRLLLVKIVAVILQKCSCNENPEMEQLKFHLDDVVNILKSTLLDNFSDVMEASCLCIEYLAQALPKSINLNGASSLLQPLSKISSHQQKKVRLAAVKSISVILLHGSSDDFQKVCSHLAQRLFDRVPQVRLAVSTCAAQLLLNWRHGESNAPLLVPLLLTSFEDCLSETQETCRKLWDQVGQAYIEKLTSNDERLKEKMDFAEDIGKPKHYPADVHRPSFGCRQYVTRIIVKLLPALKNDLQDWLVETRIKASQLLVVLILHLEETAVISQYAENLLNLMHTGTKDSEKEVVENMGRSAELYGYFVPSTTWCPMVTERLLTNPNAGELMILSKILDGSDPELLKYSLEDLAITLQDDSICLSFCTNYLSHLHACVDAMLTVSGRDCQVVRNHLFKIGISILSLAQEQQLKNEAKDFLLKLSQLTLDDIEAEDPLSELYRHEMAPLLKLMRSECKHWNAASFRLPIFSTLLQESGHVVGFFVEQVVGIFRDVLSVESVDPELQLKMFILLSKQLFETSTRINSKKQFGPFAAKVLEDLILPALAWHAGKKASAVRTAASSSLWSLSESGLLKAESIFIDSKLAASLFPSMNRLLEDDAVKTRVFICKTYKKMFELYRKDFPAHYLLTISTILLKRLDDVDDEVRLSALHCLPALNSCLPATVGKPSPEFENHFRGIYSTILLHMDDQNTLIRKAALDTLLALRERCPNLLEELTQESLAKHTHQECFMLMEQLKQLNV